MSFRLSLVVEMDNAEVAGLETLFVAARSLSGQISALSSVTPEMPRPQIVFVLPGEDADAGQLRDAVAHAAPELAAKADIEFECLPGGRYYELKNRGILVARGDIVAFLDSDTVPEENWLPKLLAPFSDPAVTAVNGHTSLMFDDFRSKVYALYWIFPLATHDRKMAAKRPLNANNCAFRRRWITAHPFPESTGFKVSCTLLTRQLTAQGRVLRQVDAHVYHRPPRGWRFFVWRALVAGRDADRRFTVLKSEHRLRRTANAFGRLFTAQWRAIRRLRLIRQVGIAPWQAPLALAMVTVFNGLAFLGQALLASGLQRDRVELVPDYVEHS